MRWKLAANAPKNTGELLSNPNTNYAGGRYGFAHASPPDVGHLLAEVESSWREFTKSKERHKRSFFLQNESEWTTHIARLKPGVGLLKEDNSCQTWANFPDTCEIDLPKEIAHIIQDCNGQQSAVAIARSGPGR